MLPEEKATIEKKKRDFSKLNDNKNPGLKDAEKLISDINILLGLYAVDKNKDLEKLIKNMIDFGKSKQWAMEGQIIEFNRIKKGQLKVKKV
ncbi:hypothetical protein KY343_05095 [Candidatus Woesearchaeota archaeon]|nr:hypothetical protein [Candidatus Woesearchaeota archaeon]